MCFELSDYCLAQPQVVGDIGSPNNVLTLSEHDCDVFSALNTDDLTKPLPLPTEKPEKCLTPPLSMLCSFCLCLSLFFYIYDRPMTGIIVITRFCALNLQAILNFVVLLWWLLQQRKP